MTSTRIDRLLSGLGALLILISSYQLFFTGHDDFSGAKLGTLTSTLSIVKTKNAVSLDWRDASSGLDVSDNQLIYTDSASSADVVFNHGNRLEIGENSLVKIKATDEHQGMDLSRGIFRAKLEGNKSLKVQMNGEDYLLTSKNADIQINLQDANGEIGVINGEVSVETNGVRESLNPETALQIQGNKISKKKISFRTLSPVKGFVKYVSSSTVDILFNWSPADRAEILLSKRPDMNNSEAFQISAGESLNVSPGLWYYRVQNESGSSLVSSFRIIQEEALTIIRPLQGEEVNILRNEVVLQWKGEKQDKFLVEWNDGQIHQRDIPSTSAIISVKPGTKFSWRVKISHPERNESIWSPWQEVKLNFVSPPDIPSNLFPDDVDYQVFSASNEKIDLTWKGQGLFELEVKSPDGESFIRRLATPFFSFEAKKQGSYLWRVRGIDDYLRSSEWTEWKNFNLQDMSQIKMSEGVQRIQLEKPDQAVSFTWKSNDGASTVFELAKDPGFQEIVQKTEVSSDTIKVNVPEVGTYFWRSRLMLPDGTLHVTEPRRVIIEPTPAPLKPQKLPDIQIELEEVRERNSVFLKKIFDFIIPSAVAEEIKGIAKITLPAKEDAKAYVIRIFQDQGLKELVLEKQIDGKYFEWAGVTSGTYYWQYAVIDYWNRKSEFSDPSRLIIKETTTSPPEKVKLISPIRAVDVEQQDLVLVWSHSLTNVKYKADIALDAEFKNILHSRDTTKTSLSFQDTKLKPSLHFWRVHAYNNKNDEVISNTGRFVVLPEKEKIIVQDFPTKAASSREKWKPRLHFAWAPSLDSYTFTNRASGEIDGRALMGFLSGGTLFRDSYVLSAELLRQSGKVFDGENYLFQRFLVDGIYLLKSTEKEKWGAGIAVGHTSSFTYNIEGQTVFAKSLSSLNYGLVIKNYMKLSEEWEFQGNVQYLLGDIKQVDVGLSLLYHYETFFLVGGLNYSKRNYDENSGKQTSMRASIGIGKEF